MPSTVAKYFAFAHLTNPNLHNVSAACAALANTLEQDLPDGPEKSAGMRKLLEAKDCFVRSALDLPTLAAVGVQTPGGQHLLLEPHQYRVVQEAAELKKKRDALLSFINSDTYEALSGEERGELIAQHGHMGEYLDVLNRRIERFGSAA